MVLLWIYTSVTETRISHWVFPSNRVIYAAPTSDESLHIQKTPFFSAMFLYKEAHLFVLNRLSKKQNDAPFCGCQSRPKLSAKHSGYAGCIADCLRSLEKLAASFTHYMLYSTCTSLKISSIRISIHGHSPGLQTLCAPRLNP